MKETVAFSNPAAFVCMMSLPPSPVGKIDLDAPPATGESDGAHGNRAVAPRDLMDTRIVNIRAKALGAPDVGADDDFFEPGCHFGLAVRLMAAIHMVFGRGPRAAAFFPATPSNIVQSCRAEMETPR